MTKRTAADLAGLLVAVALIALNAGTIVDSARGLRQQYYRHRLAAELRPVQLGNCTLARFGNANDGGYLMCENFLAAVQGAYSYGIEGRDEWGCAVAQQLNVPVHQYDCFVTLRPECAGAAFIFHEECVGDEPVRMDGRVFDTLTSQISKNGDRGKHLVVKMDVEGAEWDALGTAPDDVLKMIDQLVVEFHGIDEARFVRTLVSLKRLFVVAHVHFNNFTCHKDARPFPAFAYEVLLVNRAIADVDGGPRKPASLSPLDSPNSPQLADCQAGW